MSANPYLGSEKLALGPTIVFLKQTGPWTYGALANHVWSIAGEDDRADVNQTFLQPFLAYGTKSAWTFTLNSESSANWEATSGEEWTVPVHFVASKVVKLGHRPMSIGFGTG